MCATSRDAGDAFLDTIASASSTPATEITNQNDKVYACLHTHVNAHVYTQIYAHVCTHVAYTGRGYPFLRLFG